MIESGSFGFIAEFWPWLSTLSIYIIDRFLGGWLDWLFLPYFDFRKYAWISFLILYVILPLILVLYIYLTILVIYIYRRRHDIWAIIWDGDRGVLNRLVNVITSCWMVHASIWHSYDVHGHAKICELQKRKKGCLVVYYHGAMPIDCYYFAAWLQVHHKILARPVVDYFMFKVPGFRTFLDLFGATAGPRSRLVELLKAGHVVMISPGGVREALFSKDYQILWGNRSGFAECAIEADVPIIPMFTSNVRQVFDFPDRLKGNTFRRLYEYTRLPLSFMFGFFPVKLDTYIGDPIDTSGLAVDRCRNLAMQGVEALIRKHQRYRADWWTGLISSLKGRIRFRKK